MGGLEVGQLSLWLYDTSTLVALGILTKGQDHGYPERNSRLLRTPSTVSHYSTRYMTQVRALIIKDSVMIVGRATKNPSHEHGLGFLV